MARPLAWPDEELGDDVVLLRAWTDGDVACALEAATDPQIPRITSLPREADRDQALEWIARQHGRVRDGEGVPLAIVERATGRAVGLASVMLRPGDIGWIGYWVVPSRRGEGFATRGVGSLARWAFEGLGLVRLEIGVEPWNEASMRVAERCGFVREALLFAHERTADGDAIDLVLFSRYQQDG
ncbi:MAG: GNAT family N-acetyltransferase [Actinomycetota bacterium]